MTHWITIMGVKDRVGASSFALALAKTIQQNQASVLLLDANGDYLGDSGWRTMAELKKIPKPINAKWLHGFLNNSERVPSLSLAENRFHLSPVSPESILNQLSVLEPHFDWILVDAGSRWNSYLTAFLNQTEELLLVLGSQPGLVKELERKIEELSRAFFPKTRIGWVAWNWSADSFLTIASLQEALPIASFGGEVETVWKKLNRLPDVPKGKEITSDLDTTPFRLKLVTAVQAKMEQQKNLSPDQLEKIIRDVLEAEAEFLPTDLDRKELIEALHNEFLGLGPLEPLLQDPNITEVLVNGPGSIYIETEGKLKRLDQGFLNGEALQRTIERILLPLGRRIDSASPMVDGRLPDGSRVNIIIPPLALAGPILSIRRFSRQVLLPEDLIEKGCANEAMLKFLEEAVWNRKNILVSGGTGSGKTTLLNVLSSFIPKEERIITIEDAAELKLNQPHVVRLEARPPNIEGAGEITIRDLVRNALRMRPDRIIVGECRGQEALDMLTAMNTGHEGSLTTLHANSPRDALSRLETLVLFSGLKLSPKAIREQIASALDLVVQVARFNDGSRKIVSMIRLTGLEGDIFTLQDLFFYENGEFKQSMFPLDTLSLSPGLP